VFFGAIIKLNLSKMNVLITSAGRRVSLVRAFQAEIKNINPHGKVFAVDVNPMLSAACQVADGFFRVPSLKDATYFVKLKSICLENNIGLVIPTIDTELLPMTRHKASFKEVGIRLLVAEEDFVLKCRDKRRIHDFFMQHRVDVAKEYTKENFSLPLFIKPLDGSRSVDTYIIKDEADLTDYHFQNDKLLFLQYLDHDDYDEYTCDMYYDKNSQLKCVVPRKRIEVRDGEVSKGLTAQNEIISYLRERLSHIQGAIGCLTAQFFMHKTDKSIFGIEINPRFGGGYPLSYLAGANFPKWILEEYLGDKTIADSFDCWEDKLLMLRYDDEILVHGFKG